MAAASDTPGRTEGGGIGGARRSRRQTKIIATLGPASETLARVRDLHRAGVDLFRLNLGFGAADDHAERIAMVRSIEREVGEPIGIIADLQGPKPRIGAFRNGGIALSPGMTLRLDSDRAPGDERRVCLPHPDVIAALQPGTDLLLDDGRVRLTVIEREAGHLVVRVVAGTRLSDLKGINVPDVLMPVTALTGKDHADLRAVLDAGVDWIGLPFVQRPQDVIEARRLIGGRAGVIVKIETPSAIDHLAELVRFADAVMIARGDLGVEMPAERLPILQKRIIREARAAGKPVAITTQMLESMTSAPVPTRAEASDVATAIYDGADALMLSAETATGAFAAAAAATMDRIARAVEEDPTYRSLIDAQAPPPAVEDTPADAVIASARRTAYAIGAACIATYTVSGVTSLRAARERPEMPIVGLTPSLATARRLTLAYGVRPVHTPEFGSIPDVVRAASEIAVAHDFARNGDPMVITAAVPLGAPGTTNVMRVAWVDDGGEG